MSCPRCQGCMVWSQEPISRFCQRTMRMLRCLNCGERSDLQIQRQRRLMHPVDEDRKTTIWNRIRHLVAEAV